jgi:hypothetical protein
VAGGSAQKRSYLDVAADASLPSETGSLVVTYYIFKMFSVREDVPIPGFGDRAGKITAMSWNSSGLSFHAQDRSRILAGGL